MVEPRFTPGPWKTGDCDGFIVWAGGYRSVKWIECEPGPEAICIGNADCPGWAPRQSVLDKLSFEDLDRRDEWIEECKANACLMAASPQLYAALDPFATEYQQAGLDHLPDEALLRDVDEFNDLTVGDLRNAFAAVKQARGEQ